MISSTHKAVKSRNFEVEETGSEEPTSVTLERKTYLEEEVAEDVEYEYCSLEHRNGDCMLPWLMA